MRSHVIVLSLGGVLFEDAVTVRNTAEVVRTAAEDTAKIYAVTGGGTLARRFIETVRKLGADDAYCDLVGIAATRLNAMLLIAALRSLHVEVRQTPPRDYEEALASPERIVVLGGVSPGYTTDAVAAILAELAGAKLLLFATSVDGVYDADPKTQPTAKKFKSLTPEELTEIVMKTRLKAGSHSVIDPVAAKIIERCRVKTIVIDGRRPENILNAIHGEHNGTEIA
ncbi:MAG: UMP kinase [Candidatus Alkanophagales archaeon]|nr:MAG: UMP kinase [Candidatus Alkanophagales archaeon]